MTTTELGFCAIQCKFSSEQTAISSTGFHVYVELSNKGTQFLCKGNARFDRLSALEGELDRRGSENVQQKIFMFSLKKTQVVINTLGMYHIYGKLYPGAFWNKNTYSWLNFRFFLREDTQIPIHSH